MLEQLLFWDRKPSSRSIGVWRILILMAPLALACSIWFQGRMLADVPVRITIDRSEAIRLASRFLESQKVETAALDVSVRPFQNFGIYRSLLTHKPDALEKAAFWGFVKVVFHEPEAGGSMDVDVDLKGNVLGYRFQPPDMPVRPFSPQQAEALAAAARQARLKELPFLDFGEPEISIPPQQTTAGTYRYIWPVSFRGVPHLTGRFHLRILGGRVVENWIGLDLDPHGAVDAGSLPAWVTGVPLTLYGAVLSVYIVIRFVKRRVHKEISSERMWLVAGIGSLLFTTLQFLGDSSAAHGDFGGLPQAVVLGILATVGMLIGLLAGVFYSACEGDLRESFPHSLTSLDAVLCGRVFSRNVGRSILLGIVAASWAFLLRNAVYLAFRPPFAGMDAIDSSLDFLYSRLPAVSALLSTPPTALLISLAALLGPLTPLAYYCRGRNRLYLLLTLCGWFGFASISGEPLSAIPLALASLVVVLTLVFTFFTVDYLCSVVVLIGWQVLGFAGLSHLAPVWDNHDHWALLAGAVAMAIAAWSLFKGAPVQDAEVRPTYAHNIEERLQLQSEIAAAREAQLRLMPASAPRLQGMSIAATCLPAQQVSGDFYDFYPLGPNRVALLLSDGGGSGLATALSIALTKGYLMHKAECGASPVSTLAGVASMLGEQIRGFSADGLCYAVIEQQERLVRYARLGLTPSVLAVGQSSSVPETVHQAGDRTIFEGAIRLAPGQPLLLYTNGLSKVLHHLDSHSTNRWLLKRGGDWDTESGRLVERITSLIFRKGSATQVHEDVTLIAITASTSEPAERVA